MKLISLLKIMDEDDEIEVADENEPIDKMVLFYGTVADCKQQGYFRNGVVTGLYADNDVLYVSVNIEYQKRKRERKMRG
jgi:hypothetical protein